MKFQFKERLASFCDKYSIKVLNDIKRRPIFRSNTFFDDPLDANVVHNNPILESEPVITLEIPTRMLNNIANVESTFYNNIHDDHPRRMFETIMEQRAEERLLQEKYPAVKQAFDQYSLMLNLCREKTNSIAFLD